MFAIALLLLLALSAHAVPFGDRFTQGAAVYNNLPLQRGAGADDALWSAAGECRAGLASTLRK